MACCARDIMQTQIITVSTDAPLVNVRRLFLEEGIHGAPVVDDRMTVLGVISITDLLRAAVDSQDAAARPESHYDEEGTEFFSLDGLGEVFEARLGESRTSDCMTDSAVTVAPDASISEVATILRENQVHRVLVVQDGILEGMVSTLDLIALLEQIPADAIEKALPAAR